MPCNPNRIMTKFLLKRLLPAVLFLLLPLLLTLRGQAQQPIPAKDSISLSLHINIVKYQFLVAGDLYKIKKYRLATTDRTDADSLFMNCVATYKKLVVSIPGQSLPAYFPDSFYEEVIPVVQYFRSPELASLFITDKARLHPKPEIADPKHHDEAHPEVHKENQHTDK